MENREGSVYCLTIMEILEEEFRSGAVRTDTELLLFPSVLFADELQREDPDFERILLAAVTVREFLCGKAGGLRNAPAECVIRKPDGRPQTLIILLDMPGHRRGTDN